MEASADDDSREVDASHAIYVNTGLYRKIFEENPQEAFEGLLKEYEAVIQSNETLKAENQKLEGKLAASSDFLSQLINLKKD